MQPSPAQLAACGILALLIASLVAGCSGSPESELAESSTGKPSLLSSAQFAGPDAALDFSHGEPRMSRSMRALNSLGLDSHRQVRSPEDDRGQDALREGLAVTEDGQPYWTMRMDAVFDASGAMNFLSGTLAARIRPGDSARQGGVWFSGNFAIAGNGNSYDSLIWALGVGKGNARPPLPRIPGAPEIPARHLFLWMPWGLAVSTSPIPDQEWIHFAAVWDAELGVKLYISGQEASKWTPADGPRIQEVFSGPMRNLFPPPLDRVRIHQLSNGGVRDLRLFDAPLSSSSVRAIAEGTPPDDFPQFEEIAPDRETRLKRLGWMEQSPSTPIPVAHGDTLKITRPAIIKAREDLRSAGWLAVDGRTSSFFPSPYHGYSQSQQSTMLTVRFAEPFRVDWLSAEGVFQGEWRLALGDSPTSPPSPLAVDGFLQQRLDAGEPLDTLLLARKEGLLGEIDFFQVDRARGGATDESGRIFFLEKTADSVVPLAREKRAEWLSSFKPGDRRFAVLSSSKPSESAALAAKALRDIHLFTSPLTEDCAAGRIECFLPLVGLQRPTRVRLTIHDSFVKGREIGRYDFLITPDETGHASARLVFELGNTFVRAGDPVWISLVFEQEATLVAGASIRLIDSAEPEKVEEHWKQMLLAIWREEMARISEPRPWRTMDGTNSWWLALTYPQYEIVDRIGQELFRRFPNNPVVRSWFLFTHPQMQNLAAKELLPDPGVHPNWAVLLRENLRLYEEFVAFWTDVRRDPVTGEFGSSPHDDSDLLMDWLDLNLIADPDDRFGDALVTFADKIWNEYRRGDMPYITNGLNTRWTDDLHAYEDGINVQPPAFFARYGDPLIFERLLATAHRYDGFLFRRTADGSLEFAGTGKEQPFWSATKPPEGGNDRWWPLMLHPGFTSLWYSGNPALEEILSAIGRGAFLHGAKPGMSDSTATSSVLSAFYSHFKDPAYLQSLSGISTDGVPPWRWDTTLLNQLDFSPEQRQAIYLASRRDADERYSDLDTQVLGGGDRRFDRNWMEWQLTGKLEYLEEGLGELYKKLSFTMPVATVAGQSGDRVSIPKALISLSYLGGVAGVRNGYFYPDIAVSHEGFGTNFAALVLDRSPAHATVAFYNFQGQPLTGFLRFWNLAPGTYSITGATAREPTWKSAEEPAFRREIPLLRGEGLEITLPPQQIWILKAELKTPDAPLHPRADLALARQGCRWVDESTLEARVWNIGSQASAPTMLVLKDAQGTILARARVGAIDWPQDLRPVSRIVQLPLAGPYAEIPGRQLELSINDEQTFSEITWRNNTIAIPPPPPPGAGSRAQ